MNVFIFAVGAKSWFHFHFCLVLRQFKKRKSISWKFFRISNFAGHKTSDRGQFWSRTLLFMNCTVAEWKSMKHSQKPKWKPHLFSIFIFPPQVNMPSSGCGSAPWPVGSTRFPSQSQTLETCPCPTCPTWRWRSVSVTTTETVWAWRDWLFLDWALEPSLLFSSASSYCWVSLWPGGGPSHDVTQTWPPHIRPSHVNVFWSFTVKWYISSGIFHRAQYTFILLLLHLYTPSPKHWSRISEDYFSSVQPQRHQKSSSNTVWFGFQMLGANQKSADSSPGGLWLGGGSMPQLQGAGRLWLMAKQLHRSSTKISETLTNRVTCVAFIQYWLK